MAFVPFVESDQPTMAAFNEKFQQNYDAILATAGKVEVGSYAGTNETTKTIRFENTPEIVFIFGNNENLTTAINYSLVVALCSGLTSSLASYGFLSTKTYGLMPSSNNYASLSGNDLTLQGSGTESFNKQGRTYRYVAIG